MRLPFNQFVSMMMKTASQAIIMKMLLTSFLCILCMPLSCIAQKKSTVAMTVLRGDSSTYLVFFNLSDTAIKVPYAVFESIPEDVSQESMLIRVDTVHSPFTIRTGQSETGNTSANKSKYRYMAVHLKPKECYSIPLRGYDARRIVKFTVVAGSDREHILLNTMVLSDLPSFVQKVGW